jgi:aminopeptidase N
LSGHTGRRNVIAMPGLNLTRDEARERAALLGVDSYRVDLDFSASGDTFDSVTEIRFSAATPGASTFLDLIAARVREVTLNGRALDPVDVYTAGRVRLDDVAADNVVRVAADCVYMNTGEGLHRTVDPVDGRTYLYTHFEAPDARRLYATFEQPDLKATFAFTVTAPSGWLVLSNSATPPPVPSATPGASVWRFAPTPRISTYLTAVVAGEYRMVHDSYTSPRGQVIPLGVACRASVAEHLDADEIFAVTRRGLDYYLDAFARPYPFDKYDQVFLPEYNIGAMENVGCVTFTESFVFRSRATVADHQSRAEVILHEMAHMWFGDLVTMRWWDDLWLKESFATYMAARALHEATEYTGAWTAFASAGKARGLRQDQLPSTHPIVADIHDLEDVALNFDGITYAKGAAVLKQLVAWVGAEAFFAGVQAYFEAHAWGNTTLTDLLDALEKPSGRDLSAWSREWLQTAGPNTLRPEFTVAADGRFTSFAVRQEAPAEHPTLRGHRLAIGLYDDTGAGLVRAAQVELEVTGERTEVPALIGRARPDLVLLNDDDLTYAAIRLDEASMATLRTGISRLTDPLARALCWTAAWDMTRAAELAATDYVGLVLDGIGAETDITVVETLHENLRQAVERFVDPGHLDRVTATVVGAARRRMLDAPVGSDTQLAWARLFARLAVDADDLDLVERLISGAETVDGLAVDADLRWMLVAALARSGRLDADAIAAEAARDRTTAGAQYAAGALAARPEAAAKEAAWASVIDRDDLPNRTQEKIIGMTRRDAAGVGMLQATQVELLRPYAARYFDVVGGVWTSRTMEIARTVVTGLYPRYLIEQETVDRTDAYLARPDVPPALRRILLEGRDDVTRALAARAGDRA